MPSREKDMAVPHLWVMVLNQFLLIPMKLFLMNFKIFVSKIYKICISKVYCRNEITDHGMFGGGGGGTKNK